MDLSIFEKSLKGKSLEEIVSITVRCSLALKRAQAEQRDVSMSRDYLGCASHVLVESLKGLQISDLEKLKAHIETHHSDDNPAWMLTSATLNDLVATALVQEINEHGDIA